MLLPWTEDYSVGIKVIDVDHKGLFDAVNALHDKLENNATSLDFGAELNYFSRYVREHFDREEKIMQEYDFPDYRHHIVAHRNIRKSIYAIQKIYFEDPERIDKEKLITFFAGWLRNHILKEDMAYRPYIGGKYGRRKSDAREQVDRTRLDLDRNRSHNESQVLKAVSVQVPEHQENILKRCAAMLRSGGVDAEDLEKFVDPMYGMTQREIVNFAGMFLTKPEENSD